jgi:hypothetical protein
MATTTDRLDFLHAYKPTVSSHVVLRVADNTEHRPIGVGYLKIPDSSPRGFVMVRCYHTPGLPTTIISPDAIARAHDCASYHSISNLDGTDCSLTLRHNKRTSQDIHFPLVLVRGLLYTQPLIKPTPDEHAATSLPRTSRRFRLSAEPQQRPPIILEPIQLGSACSSSGINASDFLPTCHSKNYRITLKAFPRGPLLTTPRPPQRGL